MKTSVYIPSHITGFFNIYENPNPLKKGSCGVGFLLDKGVKTTIKTSKKEDISIKINGKEDKNNEVIIKETLKLLGISQGLKITQEIEVPIGAGFGTSAASALGVSIAISKLLDLNHSIVKSGEIAHLAEINLGSGLGDVIAQLSKGLVIREKPGAPGYGLTKNIEIEEDVFIACKNFSKIKTSDIIENEDYKKSINAIGLDLLNKFKNHPNLENFLKYSLDFSKNTNLIQKEVLNEIEEFKNQENILGSSMAMLGNTFFAMSYNKDAFESKDLDIYKLNKEGLKID